MKIGANLSGMQQNLSYATTFHVNSRLATRDAYTPMLPGTRRSGSGGRPGSRSAPTRASTSSP
jgi:hypothetical protein